MAAVLVVVVVLAVLASPTLAVETHPFTGMSIGPAETTAGRFQYLVAVTVDPSSGDVYAVDTGEGKGRLYKFDAKGAPVAFAATGKNFIEGIGGPQQADFVQEVAIAPPGSVGGTAGDIYVATGEVVKIYSPEGLELGQLQGESLCGVTTNAVGHVFIASSSFFKPTVTEFTPARNPVTSADKTGASISFEEHCNVAVSSDDHIYVAGVSSDKGDDEERWALRRLPTLNAEVTETLVARSQAVAVEPSTNDYFVSRGGEIAQYTENDLLVSDFGQGRLSGVSGVGVAGAGGDVYAADRTSGRIQVYGPLTKLPDAVAGTVGDTTRTSAVVHGMISADGGPAATCRFEYTTQAAFEAEGFEGASSAACVPAGPFTGSVTEPVSAEVSGLAVGGEYRFRLAGTNANGSLASDENGSAASPPSFETLPAVGVRTGPASNETTTSATLTGSINPEGTSIEECFFEYGPTKEYGAVVPCESPDAAEIGAGGEPVAVHANVSGLTANSEYHVRLNAKTRFGFTHGPDEIFITDGPPRILSQTFTDVGEPAVTVSGSINPDGEPTTYSVEYVTDAAYAESKFATAAKAPPAGETLPAGYKPVAVSLELTGLSPGTTYHFRISASNNAGSTSGASQAFATRPPAPVFGPCLANEPFRVGPSADLPDCRAYEQASSPDKNGESVAGLYSLLLTSEDGSRATFYSSAGTLPPGGGGAESYATYLAGRNSAAGSWASQRLLLPERYGEFAEFLGATPDLRYAVVEAGSPSTHGLFVLDTEDGAVTQIAPYEKLEHGNNIFGFDGAGGNGERVFFESYDVVPTTPPGSSPAAGHDNLYMWDRASGDVSLVGVLPSGEGAAAPPAGSFGGAYEWYAGQGTGLGGALSKTQGGAEAPLAVAAVHAISPTGDQIFFTAARTGQLYLRRGLDSGSPNTLWISAPNPNVSDPNGAKPAAFQEATPDGSRAFFLSAAKLTATSTTGAGDDGSDLYRWDAASESLVDLAPDRRDENGAKVQGLLGVNAAGNIGYFVARGALAAGAKSGQENLYRFTEEPNGSFAIALVAALENGSEASPDRRNVSPEVTFDYELGKTSRVSEDGETVLFESARSLTGYNNVNHEGINCPEGRCPELYLYSAQTEKVSCVSCNPTGVAPLGAASLQSQFFYAYLTPTQPPAVAFSRNLSANGTRVFFQSPDPLVATDINGNTSCPASHEDKIGPTVVRAGTGRCQDVYEWEAAGSGSCETPEASGGCLYLLSSGQSDTPSYFVGASTDGSDAFLATSSQLVPSDRDHVADLYDVREGGGLASQYATPPTPCASTAACRGEAAPAAPAVLSLGSSVFSGPGNLIQTPPPPPPISKRKSPTRAQLLAKALKHCHAKHQKDQRRRCERPARKHYSRRKK